MNIEVLLTEAEIAAEFVESIEARDLPEKFFYWTPQSVKAWEDLAAQSAASLQETWEALAARAASLTKPFGNRVPVISFGAGEALKDRVLLRALAADGREVKYYPVDASQQLLETACAGAEDDDCEVLGIKADISSPMHMVLAADVSEAPRLFLMVGNTLGGFDPMDQIRHVAACVKKGDILIIDANLHPGTPATPTEEQKRFVFAPLASAGVIADDGEIEFSERPDDRLDGLFMLTRRFMASRDLRLLVAGREFQVARGERILLNFRYLFTPEAFRWLLTEHAGLRIVGELPGGDGKFLTAVCIKA
ncbi:MAG: L-histidine N(alpha)-methyltransferase [Acidobacteriota bacterium]